MRDFLNSFIVFGVYFFFFLAILHLVEYRIFILQVKSGKPESKKVLLKNMPSTTKDDSEGEELDDEAKSIFPLASFICYFRLVCLFFFLFVCLFFCFVFVLFLFFLLSRCILRLHYALLCTQLSEETVNASDDDTETDEESDEEGAVAYNYSFFHVTFMLVRRDWVFVFVFFSCVG
jgi:hypothetical protein